MIDGKDSQQVARADLERAQNLAASERGLPLPHPNLWDELDSTKVLPGATDDEVLVSVRAFLLRCPPPRPRRHVL